jgi:outer membrane biosynthesis protein TonB
MSKRLFKFALLASLLLHAMAFVGIGILEQWRLLDLTAPDVSATPRVQDEPLQFELVESPDNVPPEEPEEARLVSDKSGRARNPQANDLPIGEAFSEGLTNLRELPRQGNSANDVEPVPPMKPQQTEPSESPPKYAELGTQGRQLRPAREFTREFLTGEPPRPPARSEPSTPRYKQEASRAPEVGDFSFNTYAWDFAPYLLALRSKIKRNIFPPPAFTKMGIISGDTVVRFRIYPDGRLGDLQVLDYNGHRSLMVTSVNAVKFAAPFLPLPEDFPEAYLEVTGRFSYIVMR